MLLEYLLEHGADINQKNNIDKTVLDYVLDNNAPLMVKWLIANGAKKGAEIQLPFQHY
jgi:ankyrin repeat protein